MDGVRCTRVFRQPAATSCKAGLLPSTAIAALAACDGWALGADSAGRLFAWDADSSQCEVVATPSARIATPAGGSGLGLGRDRGAKRHSLRQREKKAASAVAKRKAVRRRRAPLVALARLGPRMSLAASVGVEAEESSIVRLHVLRAVAPGPGGDDLGSENKS